MVKYKEDGTHTIDNLQDALELLGKYQIWTSVTDKAKKDPYGKKLRKVFFKGDAK